MKKILLSLFLIASCDSDKGKVKDENLIIVINDIEYKLYLVFDGQQYLRILVPTCVDCKIPFQTSTPQTKAPPTTTVIIPPKPSSENSSK